MDPVKFAVVGCGHIGKRHAEMIERNPEAMLVALIDEKEMATLNIGDYNVPFFQSLESFLQSGVDADVINIATPNGLHATQALQCLEANKHVVIEKPVALTKADAEKIIFKALHVHKHVFAVMQNRYSPPVVLIKELISSGKPGDIYMVQLNCYWNRDERYYKPGNWHGTKELDGGTLFTQFSHFIDILYWLLVDIENIQSKLQSFNHKNLTAFEDSGTVTFDLCSGGIGSLNFSTAVWEKNMESSITIVAQNGSIKIGGQYMDKIEYCHIQDYSLPEIPDTNPGNDYGGYKGSAANHNFIIQNVIDVLHSRSSITTNALEGLKVVDIIERIYAAGKK
ncbi:Gfo/Idh/MocA family oxidoreductase [soil metagenome]